MKPVMLERVLEIINNVDNMYVTKGQQRENLTDLGLDSIMFIQLIVLLEEEFECEIPDSKLSMLEMNTVERIVIVLQELYYESNRL